MRRSSFKWVAPLRINDEWMKPGSKSFDLPLHRFQRRSAQRKASKALNISRLPNSASYRFKKFQLVIKPPSGRQFLAKPGTLSQAGGLGGGTEKLSSKTFDKRIG